MIADLLLEVCYVEGEPLEIRSVRVLDNHGVPTGPDLFQLMINSYFIADREGLASYAVSVMDSIVDIMLADHSAKENIAVH